MESARNVREPDWDYWSKRLSAPLWQAVLLSVGREAETFSDILGIEKVGNPPYFIEFKKRLALSLDHIKFGVLSANFNPHSAEHHEVLFIDFAGWAEGLDLPLPERFPRSVPQIAKPTIAIRHRNTKSANCRLALAELYPEGVPTGVKVADLCEAVNKWLSQKSLPTAAEKTVRTARDSHNAEQGGRQGRQD